MVPPVDARTVHLVGSVALDSAEEVFRLAASALGSHLRRIPDGETGDRKYWVGWQQPRLSACPGLESDPIERRPNAYGVRYLSLRDGVRADDCQLGPLGYAEAACSSYAVFAKLKADGVIATSTRFQVSLPTPIAPITLFVSPRHQEVLEPVYEQRLLAELRQICATIPHRDLAVQWDACVEFCFHTGFYKAFFRDIKANTVARLIHLGEQVPADVELGYHFCHGDSDAVPQPFDTGFMAEVGSAVLQEIRRPVAWLHIPIPVGRGTNAEFYEPLRALRAHPRTEVMLGLAHPSDGVDGARRRMDLARRFLPDFGVAAPCGLGRSSSELVPMLLRLYRALCLPAGSDDTEARQVDDALSSAAIVLRSASAPTPVAKLLALPAAALGEGDWFNVRQAAYDAGDRAALRHDATSRPTDIRACYLRCVVRPALEAGLIDEPTFDAWALDDPGLDPRLELFAEGWDAHVAANVKTTPTDGRT